LARLSNVPAPSPEGTDAKSVANGAPNDTVSPKEASGAPLYPVQDGPTVDADGNILPGRYTLSGQHVVKTDSAEIPVRLTKIVREDR
jgi:hypothetical protein